MSGLGHADQFKHPLDAVFRSVQRSANSAEKLIFPAQLQILAELLAQLVLGGDRDHLGSGLGEGGEEVGAQQLGAGHHHGGAAGGVQIVVAGNAMHGRAVRR